jgi:hypothetical protein
MTDKGDTLTEEYVDGFDPVPIDPKLSVFVDPTDPVFKELVEAAAAKGLWVQITLPGEWSGPFEKDRLTVGLYEDYSGNYRLRSDMRLR